MGDGGANVGVAQTQGRYNHENNPLSLPCDFIARNGLLAIATIIVIVIVTTIIVVIASSYY